MIHVDEHKNTQHHLPSEKYFHPKKLYLPLSQHIGKPAVPCVNVGDQVKEGDVIANEDGFISARVHAPISGKITAIDLCRHPVLKKTPCIIMECSNEPRGYKQHKDLESLSRKDLQTMVKDAGIVGMGGASFPSHVKLAPPKEIDTLIINGCECEPYLACDYRLMVENINEIFHGIELICQMINPKTIIFAVEDNKPEVVKKVHLIKSMRRFKLPKLEVSVLPTGYPQGGEKQLIESVTDRRVPGGKLPMDVGCLVHNVGTCFAIYEAVYFSKPLIERLVTFAGDALEGPKNLWVKIGTTIQELIDAEAIKLKRYPKKIICGGPMMGVSMNGYDYPITKASGGFLFLTSEAVTFKEGACLRCARCVDACPMNLLPLEYAKRVKLERYDKLSELNIVDCIECGSCTYMCPAQIPIIHYIKLGKKYIPKDNGK
jgi:electron transport complex protein RnfC